MKLENKAAIITGGTRGIGKAIASSFADEGALLLLTYIGNDVAAEETRKELEAKGAKVEIMKGDISDEDFSSSVVARAKEIYGGVDILVNNAGITKDKLFLRMKAEEFESVVNTNLNGSFYMLKAVAPLMTKKRYGRIINMSSVVGIKGNPGQVNYSASKAGVIGLTLSAAKELGVRGITVNAVAPGYISTDMTGAMTDEQKEAISGSIVLGRPGEPEEVASLITFLASDEAGYITGQVISIDGGLRI